jgi:SPX domain protein involved in polyphosphate accumulation
MSQSHRLQQQRFELKYLVDERITPAMRDFVSGYLELDEYGLKGPNLSYAVHSLYLDSADLKTYQASVNGAKNRFKLRLRYYDDRPETPVFFEVKARVDNCILKQRCGVRREAVALLVAGQLPEPGQLLSKEPRHLVALQRFNLLQSQLNARPKAHNQYLREAWVSTQDNSIRVTFDRDIRIEPCFVAKAVTEMTRPVRVFPEFTVLELKFTARHPNWLKEMVQRFDLMQSSSAKYVEGVVLLGEHRFHDGEKAFDWQGLVPIECASVPQTVSAPASKTKQTATYE